MSKKSPGAERTVVGAQAFVAATRIDEANKHIDFKDALLLARLVLEHGGGPVATKGKRAFTGVVTARRPARLELAELDEGWGRAAGSRSSTAWTLSASYSGTQLVQQALDKRDNRAAAPS